MSAGGWRLGVPACGAHVPCRGAPLQTRTPKTHCDCQSSCKSVASRTVSCLHGLWPRRSGWPIGLPCLAHTWPTAAQRPAGMCGCSTLFFSSLPKSRVAWMCAMRTACTARAAQPGHLHDLHGGAAKARGRVGRQVDQRTARGPTPHPAPACTPHGPTGRPATTQAPRCLGTAATPSEARCTATQRDLLPGPPCSCPRPAPKPAPTPPPHLNLSSTLSAQQQYRSACSSSSTCVSRASAALGASVSARTWAPVAGGNGNGWGSGVSSVSRGCDTAAQLVWAGVMPYGAHVGHTAHRTARFSQARPRPPHAHPSLAPSPARHPPARPPPHTHLRHRVPLQVQALQGVHCPHKALERTLRSQLVRAAAVGPRVLDMERQVVRGHAGGHSRGHAHRVEVVHVGRALR